MHQDYLKRVTYCSLRRDFNQADVVNCIELACEAVSVAQLASCMTANRRYVNQFLPEDKQL